MRAVLVLGLVLAVLVVPRDADAWTNAQVASATAKVRVEADARVAVEIDLRIRVLEGWLSELEVAGLDRPLVLDEASPAVFTTAAGEAVPFQAVADSSGRVTFGFARPHAPRAGEYLARFGYTSSLAESALEAAGDDRVRYPWTFPAWAAGLDSVRIEVDAPARAVAEAAIDPAYDGPIETSAEGARTRFVFHRAHLPRGVPWIVGFTIPRDAVPAALRPAVATRPTAAPIVTSRDGRPQPITRYVAGIFALVALGKRATFSRRARSRGATIRPLVPLPPLAFGVFVVLAALVAARFWARSPEVAFGALASIVLVSAQRCAKRTTTPRLGSFRPATAGDRRGARYDAVIEALSPASWFDASRLLGVVVFASIAFVLVRVHLREPADSVDSVFTVPHSIVLLFLLFAVAPASMIPGSIGGRLSMLERVARTLRLPDGDGPGLGLRLVVHRDANDIPQDARLRIVSEHRAPGLVRLDVAIVERAALGGFVASAVVLVVVRQGSEAERILVRAAGSSSLRSAPGGRRARVLPLDAATIRLLDRFAEPVATEVPVRALAPRSGAEASMHA